MNFREGSKMDKFEKYEKVFDEEHHDQGKKPIKTKSIDFDIKLKTSYETAKGKPEESKDSHNIEELQKRLAYLKNKRLEFERKKYVICN